MGIDLAKMREKHSALTNRGGDSSDNFWKPTEGTHQIRLVCPPSGDPFFEAYYHYGMGSEGKTTVLSPRTNGDSDPIAEWGTQLWNEGTESSKESAKRFWPKMRVFAPVVVRGEENKGVRWWGFSRTTYQALLDIVLDPEYGDVTDTEAGTDIRLDYGKKTGQSYPTTDLRPARSASKLAATDAEITEILNTIKDAKDVFEVNTYEQCEKVLNSTLGEETPNDSVGTSRFGNKTETSDKTSSSSFADIESAWDDLLS